ncbi:MAG: hypothetical protein JJU32_08480 [Phormidium sp. BM_Day4_Bin.17]|nr:hypothetical protein [Phormidium sp. BM_Day4_Bin.17]UCJ14443.1 MAG: hypothetical protein JWS08_15560 [Phormidium sp. PBR-2020]
MKLNYSIEVRSPIKINDYEELGGLSKSSLIKALSSVASSLRKREISKIGIVIDLDFETQATRLALVNECMNETFKLDSNFTDTGELIDIQTVDGEISLKAACYFINVDGKGELETLLKRIKSKPSPHADCLEQWRACLNEHEISIKNKEFDKFWVSNYLRYDTCSPEERKQTGSKCSFSNFDYIMKNKINIWDLSSPLLNELKEFLRLFNE